MQYHALALAEAGNPVDLVGYRGTLCAREIEDHARILVHRLRDPLSRRPRGKVLAMFWGICRVGIAQLQLASTLLFGVRRPDVILVQNPPAIATLGAAWLAARVRGARLVIDWHNFGWSMVALRVGAGHPLVRLARAYERVVGRLADSHLCVSRAMQTQLAEACGIPGAIVLYDEPAERYEPAPSTVRPALLRQLLDQLLPEAELWRGASNRPVCIVCPTSWSEDEDFSLLLDALSHLEERIRERAAGAEESFPPILVLITGLGPLRERFEARIADLELGGIRIRTAWFSAEDYARLLSSADLGLCFHRSSSGVDLPMKLADMTGSGLPVCAFDYGACLAERLSHGENGLLFSDSRQLADQLYELFVDFPNKTPELDRLRHALDGRHPVSWTTHWQQVARSSVVDGARPTAAPASTGDEQSLSVAFFHPDLGLGGAERWVVDAATSLQEAGHRVAIVTSSHDRDRCFQATRDGTLDVRVRGSALPAHIGHHLQASCAIARTVWAIFSTALRGEHFDLAVVDLVPHAIPALRMLIRAPVVYYCHYPDRLLAEPRSWVGRLYRLPIDGLEAKAVAQADRILVNSRFTAAALSRVHRSVGAGASEVLYPGVECAAEGAIPRTEPGRDETPCLLCISRFDRRKRLGLAIQTLAGLAAHLDPETLRRTRLVLAGSYDPVQGESERALQELQSLAEELGVAEQVRYVKSPSDAVRRDLLSQCRCVIYTPEDEHFGLVPLEAMAAERPVVAVRSGGPLETVRDGVTGLLCRPTPEAFAKAVAGLLLDPANADRMGRAGRAFVEANFSRRSFAERWTAIVEETAKAATR